MRRGFLRALVALSIAASLPARAQDARSSEAQDAARAWLALVDKSDVEGAYDAAGNKFKRGMAKADWIKALVKTREPYGANAQRTIAATQFHNRIQGVGKGDYAVLLFRSSFARRDFAQEQVTLENTPKGWQVIGYVIS
ncbi:MAG TPA: DUF4019 domain-containing protein [Casimicrobiaceae bacterium]|jgi:hypothetical protein